MNTKEYTLDNGREQLNKDWDWLKQDNGSGNMERIIDQLFKEITESLDKYLEVLKAQQS